MFGTRPIHTRLFSGQVSSTSGEKMEVAAKSTETSEHLLGMTRFWVESSQKSRTTNPACVF